MPHHSSPVSEAIVQIKAQRPRLGWKAVAEIVCRQLPAATPNMVRKRYRRLVRAGVIDLGPQRRSAAAIAPTLGSLPAPPTATTMPVRTPWPAGAGEDLFGGDETDHDALNEAGSLSHELDRARRRLDAREMGRLRQTLARLGERRAWEDRLVAEFRASLRPFSPQVPRLPTPPGNDAVPGEPEAAVLLFSDAHVGQHVDPGQTRGAGRYGPAVYLDRLAYLEGQVGTQLASAGTQELHVFLLGDIVHGRLDHGAEGERTSLLTDQVRLAAWSLGQFLLRLAARVPTLYVHAAGGNHGRWMDQRRVPTVNRHSNLDHVVYGCVQAILWAAKTSNVRFELNAEPLQVVDVLGLRIAARHGDQVRGGGGGVDKLGGGLPTAALARDVVAVSALFGSFGERPPDYYVIGDKHRHLVMSLPTGEFLVNGSFVGVDEYSYGLALAPARPMQIMFGINRHGKTWQRDVSLRLAEPGGGLSAYELPADLRAIV